ncbi:calcineurin subunit B-like isoform X2 [Acropora millepora]|uniref:calcineurin subunit B-like isoform X2 n=1 Tax=Acropora millepora TaxID=45264 RepID=UPI001CF21209|nr:calcineurin subunit B-like isoform X2 [Acropora millepora]
MGAAASVASEDELRQLEANSHFTAKEIPKLLKRFVRDDPEGRNGGISLKQFLDIPEISTNPIMPKVASYYLEKRTNKLTYSAFITMMSRLSSRNPLDDKRQFAFQVLDRDNDGCLSYHELFSLFRIVTGPTLKDDQVLAALTSILSRSELQQASKVTFEEFTQVVLLFCSCLILRRILSFWYGWKRKNVISNKSVR